ncbi:hypothetical protein [Botrimarina sp.]|uniref:hypothetical protein n=1 Tax=Botrimarina sp. TaxID=2795802 RepID=UPI0032EEC1C7
MPTFTGLPLRLRDLLPGARYVPADADPTVGAVRLRAASVEPGDLYVHTDEFDFAGIELAAERGAAAVVTEHPVRGLAAPQAVVSDARAALAAVQQNTTRASSPLRVMRVGGASGGQRSATLLAAIYAAACRPVGLRTESLEDDGEQCVRRAPRSLRGPEAWMRRCRLGGVGAVIDQAIPVVEAVTAEPAQLACVTTLRCDGLDAAGRRVWPSPHSHRESVLAALGPITAATQLVINADDPDACRLAADHRGPVLTYGESGGADLLVAALEQHSGGQSLLFCFGPESACVQLPTPGRAARRDAAAALAAALASGTPLMQAATGLEAAPPTPLTMEPLVCGQRFSAWLDTAVRPGDLADALEAAGSVAPRVLAAVRLSASLGVAREQLAVASRMADRVLVHGPAIARLPEEAYPENTTPVDDRLAALAVVLGLADDGEAVVIAGCVDAEIQSDGRQADRATAADLLRRRLRHDDRAAA